jgi:FOG: EAL domain
MRNAESSLEVMRSLRTLGVHFSIDDFGTGYTSLPYLKQLPVSSVKIDRTFIRDLGASEGDTAIVSAALAIAHSLKLRVIAEGVETIEQVTFLRQRRCDAAQGFYFSRPVAAEAIPSLLAEPPSMRQSSVPRLHL